MVDSVVVSVVAFMSITMDLERTVSTSHSTADTDNGGAHTSRIEMTTMLEDWTKDG